MVSNSNGSECDFAGQYNESSSCSSHMETDSLVDRNELVDSIIESVGYGKILDVGCGEGLLVRTLVEKGLDAYGVDISQVAIDRANSYMPGRFICESALELPFADQEFDTVVSTDFLQHIDADNVPRAIAEVRRVCKKHIYFQISTSPEQDEQSTLTVEGRDWWESSFFQNGFVRNPAYYKINSLDDLSSFPARIKILLDVNPAWPQGGVATGALSSVTAESHAYLSAYKELASLVKPGDSVFNWSDKAGEGAAVIRSLSNARSVSVFIADDYQTQVWEKNSNHGTSLKRFSLGSFRSECSQAIGQVNLVIVDGDNPSIIKDDAIYCALVPGGRLVVLSIDSDSATDSYPLQLGADFDFEKSGKLSLLGINYKYSSYIASIDQPDKAYVPSVHGYSTPPLNLINFERDYVNPWFPLNAVVNGVRTSNFALINSMCSRVLADDSKVNTADFGASLCIMGYRLLEAKEVTYDELQRYISAIDEFVVCQTGTQNSHLYRWLVSLSYLKAKLLLKAGDVNGAAAEFVRVVEYDARLFSPTLGTKIVSAYIELGNIRCAMHDYESAVDAWTRGMHTGIELLQSDEVEWIGNSELPIKGALYEATQIADLVNVCTLSLRALKLYMAGVLPFNRIWEDASDSVFLINKKRFNLLQKQNTRLLALEDALFSQADLLEKRWNVMQSMEAMIQERDLVIANLSKMLEEERLRISQSMDPTIGERDLTIAQNELAEGQLSDQKTLDVVTQEGDQIIAQDKTMDSVSEVPVVDLQFGNERSLDEVFATQIHTVPFADLALTNYLFTSRLYKAVRASGANNLFFFAREGQPLKQMFDFYQASIKPTEAIRTHYLKVSRRSTLLLSLGKLGEENFEILFRQYRRLSISDFLKSLVLEEHGPCLEKAMGLASGSFDAIHNDLPSAQMFIDLLKSRDFNELYESERVTRGKAFSKYIENMVGGEIPEELHVVDVGWKGSIQDNLYNWFYQLRGEAAVVKGYYLGLVSPGNKKPNNEKSGLVFSSMGHLTPGFHVFNENRSLFEIALHADHGSAQKYVINTDDKAVVVQDEFLEQQMIEEKISPVTQEMMRLFGKVVGVMISNPITDEQLLQATIGRHARMVFEPKASEIQWLLGLSHRENFGVFSESRFVISEKPPTLIEKFKFTLDLVLRRRPSELGFWPWLTIKTKGVRGLSVAYKLFRLWKSR